MEIDVDTDLTVGALIDLKRGNILQVNHEYQRGLRWSEMQKCMFIDSIFRGYSIPAFYFHEKKVSAASIENTIFDIVDGQQRINAIYEFSEGAFELLDPSEEGSKARFPNFVKNESCPWGGKRFDELTDELKGNLKSHTVVVYKIVAENENSIRDLFIRLQGGTPLTPQDKRDSWPGNFTEFVLKIGGKSEIPRFPGHKFFKELSKPKNYMGRQLAAQTFMLFWTLRNEGKFCDIKSQNVDDFYHAQVGFDEESDDAKRFRKICDVLYEAMRNKPPIVGHYVIHLLLLVDSLLEDYAHGWEGNLAGAFLAFAERIKGAAKDMKEGRQPEHENYYEEYGRLAQTQTDIARTIRRRHAFFNKEMLEILSPRRKDSNRGFSFSQRQTIFARDEGLCQWCRMDGGEHKTAWADCEIHHVDPHTEGGATSIENGALVHRDCHPKAKERVDEFRDWWRTHGPAAPEPEFVQQNNANRQLPPNGTAAKFEYGGRTYMGEIRERRLYLEGHTDPYGAFSAASGAVTGTSRNGWNDWLLMLPGKEEWILAADWREES